MLATSSFTLWESQGTAEMLRMRSVVLTGVLVYGVILVVLHQTFMTGQKEEKHDALVHAILRDQSRLLKLKPGFFLQNQPPKHFFIQTTFNLGLQMNISSTLNSVTAMHNFTLHPVLKEWTSLMKRVIPEGILQRLQPSQTSNSILSELEANPRLMNYWSFNLTLPRLQSEADVRLFKLNSANRNAIGMQESDKLFGKISILHNVTILYEADCGFRTKDEEFYPKGGTNNPKTPNPDFVIDGAVIPLLVPDSHAFQHFIDGLLPKLIQVLDFALLPGVQILVFYPRDPIIFEMLEALGIYREKIVFYPSHHLHLKTMINTCITPPLHPLLWGAARRLLKVPDQLSAPRDSLVILLTRAGSFNPGRNMLNIHEVKNALGLRYRSRLVIFKGGLNLRQSRALFSRAAIILGVHGGAFYNLMFAPRTSHIIEFMPFYSFGDPIPGTAHQIFWMQAQLIGQPYWRLQLTPHTAGDVFVPIANLTAILDKVDIALKTRTL